MDTTATLEPQRMEIDAGQVGTVVLTVRNDSEIVENYTLQVVGDLAEFCTIEPEHVSAYPGQAATAVLTVRPPRDPEVLAGEHFYGVHVLPAKRPEDATVPEGAIEILPFHDTAAELSPQTSRSKRGSRYRVAVENRGNAPVAVALAAKNASDELGLTLGESELTVGPGATASTDVRAEPVGRLWRGTPVAYPFTIAVRPEEGPEIALAGTQYQEPVLPAWTLKAVLGLALLAVLSVVASQLIPGDPPEVVAVPAVVGSSVSDAEAALDEKGLKSEHQEVFHDTVDKGDVVSANPAPGQEIKKGSTVVLDVSQGPKNGHGASNGTSHGSTPDEVVISEDLVGMSETEARAALESAGLVAGATSEANSASAPRGEVVETVPAGGTKVSSGSEVQLVVSTGMVEVPSLVGRSREEAIAALEDEDVDLDHEIVPAPRADVPPDEVVNQSPGGGERVVQGSTIMLTVSETPPPPTVPDDVDVVAALGTVVGKEWPENPWAGSVDVTSIVLDNPSDYAGTFSIELHDTASGTRTLLHRGDLSGLVEGQNFVVDPEESAGGEASYPPLSGPIDRFELTAGQNLVLAMSCATELTDGTSQTAPECIVTFTVDGEVREPEASG